MGDKTVAEIIFQIFVAVLTNLALLAPMFLMVKRRNWFCVIMFACACIISMGYHISEVTPTRYFIGMEESRWHQLDNVYAMMSVVVLTLGFTVVDINSRTNNDVNNDDDNSEENFNDSANASNNDCVIGSRGYIEVVSWIGMVLTVYAQYSAVPIILVLSLMVYSWIKARKVPVVFKREFQLGLLVALVGLCCFLVGLQDQFDRYRVAHGLWHVGAGVGCYYLLLSRAAQWTYSKNIRVNNSESDNANITVDRYRRRDNADVVGLDGDVDFESGTSLADENNIDFEGETKSIDDGLMMIEEGRLERIWRWIKNIDIDSIRNLMLQFVHWVSIKEGEKEGIQWGMKEEAWGGDWNGENGVKNQLLGGMHDMYHNHIVKNCHRLRSKVKGEEWDEKIFQVDDDHRLQDEEFDDFRDDGDVGINMSDGDEIDIYQVELDNNDHLFNKGVDQYTKDYNQYKRELGECSNNMDYNNNLNDNTHVVDDNSNTHTYTEDKPMVDNHNNIVYEQYSVDPFQSSEEDDYNS